MIVYNDEVQATDCEPGVKRKVLSYTDEIMMCEVSFEEGAEGYQHAHPHLQTTYVVKGSFVFTIAGENVTVNTGDSLMIPGNSMHGVKALKEGILLDVFHPMRKEFLS